MKLIDFSEVQKSFFVEYVAQSIVMAIVSFKKLLK